MGEIKGNTFKFSIYFHCLPPCQPLDPQPGSFNLSVSPDRRAEPGQLLSPASSGIHSLQH